MNWKRGLLVSGLVLVLLGAAVVGGLALYSDHLYRDSYGSYYSYEVSFASNETLDDLTIYVPVPVDDSGVRLVDSTVTATSWDETTPADAPPVNVSIVETEYGPMLAITADAYPVETKYYRFEEHDGIGERIEIPESEYDPSDPDMLAYDKRSVRVEVFIEAERSIDTRNPTGTEPLLAPEFSRWDTTCEDTHFETVECFGVETSTYLSYEAPPETRTSLWVELRGSNEWWIFGWSGNEYSERFLDEFTGAQDGWVAVEAELVTGWGNYRGDPPNPDS